MLLKIATRGSALALKQTQKVIQLLSSSAPEIHFEVVVVSTIGDRDQTSSISDVGGQGIFVTDVQSAVLSHKADLAVHSAKDLQALTIDGLTLASVPERADPRDVLIGSRWEDLPKGATVATGSVRRRSHLLHLRPDLNFCDLRGNIETRLSKTKDSDALVIAKAALDRLKLSPEKAEPLDYSILLPQVGQGALAVECRIGDSFLIEVLQKIENSKIRKSVDSERAFLAEIGSGCSLPVAAFAEPSGSGFFLKAAVASLDGSILIKVEEFGNYPQELGQKVANKILNEQGGKNLLEGA